MVTLENTTTGVRWRVPKAVVEFWTRDGSWKVVDASAAPQRRTTLVLARTKADADRYIREAGLGADGVYVGAADALRGVRGEDVDVAVVEGFAEHRKHDELVEALALAGVRLPAPPITPAGPGGGEDDPGTDSSTDTSKE